MQLLKCKDELRNIQYGEFCWLWFFYLHAQTLLCMLFLFVPLPFCVFWAGVTERGKLGTKSSVDSVISLHPTKLESNRKNPSEVFSHSVTILNINMICWIIC